MLENGNILTKGSSTAEVKGSPIEKDILGVFVHRPNCRKMGTKPLLGALQFVRHHICLSVYNPSEAVYLYG